MGLGFGVQGFGCGVCRLGFGGWVLDLGLRVLGVREYGIIRIGAGFGVYGAKVWGL